jgi:sigma-B regulation protein RsbU (phosphoserine phosphatase)
VICGYLTIGSDGRITNVNATLTAWTGFETDKFVGRRLHQFLNMAGRIYYETHVAPLLGFKASSTSSRWTSRTPPAIGCR